MNGDVLHVELGGPGRELAADLVEALLAPVDQVHLVDRHDDVRNAQQGGDEGMPARLLQNAVAGVDQHHCEVGGRCAGDHVARVLNVTGRVGDDEFAAWRGEVAVGHVDRDALLALRAQAVGQQGQVDCGRTAPPAGALDGRQLVLEDALRVVEQPADERATCRRRPSRPC